MRCPEALSIIYLHYFMAEWAQVSARQLLHTPRHPYMLQVLTCVQVVAALRRGQALTVRAEHARLIHQRVVVGPKSCCAGCGCLLVAGHVFHRLPKGAEHVLTYAQQPICIKWVKVVSNIVPRSDNIFVNLPFLACMTRQLTCPHSCQQCSSQIELSITWAWCQQNRFIIDK